MARARNIKPGLYKNEDLAECSIWARYIFPGMWMMADRAGRMEDRPKRIKAELLPYDEISVAPLLDELASRGFILRYENAGQHYIEICKFSEHQTPHVREQASSIPAPEKEVESIAKAVPSTIVGSVKTSPRSPDSLNPSSLITESLSLDLSATQAEPSAPADILHDDFSEAWDAYPKRQGASKADSHKAWKARIKAGATAKEILDGVWRYAAYIAETRTEDRFIKQPQTFFGPGEHFKADWSISPRASPGASQLGKAGQATARAAEEWLMGQEHG